MRFLLSVLLLAGLAGCGPSGPEGPVGIAVIGEADTSLDDGVRLSPAAQHLRAATAEGLVTLDQSGQVVPALAERWIVTDDGQSYIFRLRNSEWKDGETIAATHVRDSLRKVIADLRGTSLGIDLGQVEEVRAMTGRVIEIRLGGAMPDFLRLLAQPELGIRREGEGDGPMQIVSDADVEPVELRALPPESRGLPRREDWQELVRPLTLQSLPAREAVDAFAAGSVELVLNGRVANFPLADTGPLTRGRIRIDGARGMFGLLVRNDRGFLSEARQREALSMAIDRDGLMQPLNIGGWRAATWIVPIGLLGDAGPQLERWDNLSLQERRGIARQRVASWEAAQGRPVVLRIALPPGPGSDTLFSQIAGDFGLVGVSAIQVEPGEDADLELRDRLARYDSPYWYFNQLNCELRIGLCDEETDRLVAQSLGESDPAVRRQLLARAHRMLVAQDVFMPLGAPVRWSLVRGDVFGFEANEWGLHPLFPLSLLPN